MEPLPDEWSLSIVDTIGDIRHLRSEIAEARAARLAEPEVETEKVVDPDFGECDQSADSGVAESTRAGGNANNARVHCRREFEVGPGDRFQRLPAACPSSH